LKYAKRTDKNQPGIVESLRKCGVNVTVTNMGNDFPDILCGYKKTWILLELKMPDSDITWGQMAFIADAHGHIGVATNAEDARRIVKEPHLYAITDAQQHQIHQWLVRHPDQGTLSVRRFFEVIENGR
jgi:hypothetical protein